MHPSPETSLSGERCVCACAGHMLVPPKYLHKQTFVK